MSTIAVTISKRYHLEFSMDEAERRIFIKLLNSTLIGTDIGDLCSKLADALNPPAKEIK